MYSYFFLVTVYPCILCKNGTLCIFGLIQNGRNSLKCRDWKGFSVNTGFVVWFPLPSQLTEGQTSRSSHQLNVGYKEPFQMSIPVFCNMGGGGGIHPLCFLPYHRKIFRQPLTSQSLTLPSFFMPLYENFF